MDCKLNAVRTVSAFASLASLLFRSFCFYHDLQHVCADTLRSIAVLVAATIAFFFDSVDGGTADSVAALIVSFIIIVSLIPLLEGLFITAHELWRLYRDPNKSSTTSFEAAEEALVV